MTETKLQPPFQIDGRAVIRGRLGEEFVVDGVTVIGVDADGYIRISVQITPTRKQTTPPKKIGTRNGKKLVYNVFQIDNYYRVEILSSNRKRVVRSINQTFLVQVYQKIPFEGKGFNAIVSDLKNQVIDALHLKAALVVLEIRGLVEPIPEGNRVRYRRLKPFTLD
jgi:hypothetical protein